MNESEKEITELLKVRQHHTNQKVSLLNKNSMFAIGATVGIVHSKTVEAKERQTPEHVTSFCNVSG